ncbi:hypothetical protein LMG28614_02604 [Paraburkholderia ultramafica]|uniref:Uncharacterized protein n=1 Tax=Paraburkholderia ultramafica TaxID=1544867 RepID=A0A6S7CER2_9BURK|nr:hypothetical protein LMG28614_02604 [Paraburkholderia ultramafica]
MHSTAMQPFRASMTSDATARSGCEGPLRGAEPTPEGLCEDADQCPYVAVSCPTLSGGTRPDRRFSGDSCPLRKANRRHRWLGAARLLAKEGWLRQADSGVGRDRNAARPGMSVVRETNHEGRQGCTTDNAIIGEESMGSLPWAAGPRRGAPHMRAHEMQRIPGVSTKCGIMLVDGCNATPNHRRDGSQVQNHACLSLQRYGLSLRCGPSNCARDGFVRTALPMVAFAKGQDVTHIRRHVQRSSTPIPNSAAMRRTTA